MEVYPDSHVGKSYCVTFHINLGSYSKYALDQIGAFFDDGSIKSSDGKAVLVKPQVTSLYPNPANNQLTVNLGSAKLQSIKLINLQGQEIISSPIEKARGGDFELNTSQLAEGMYILIAEGENAKVQQKVVVKHE